MFSLFFIAQHSGKPFLTSTSYSSAFECSGKIFNRYCVRRTVGIWGIRSLDINLILVNSNSCVAICLLNWLFELSYFAVWTSIRFLLIPAYLLEHSWLIWFFEFQVSWFEHSVTFLVRVALFPCRPTTLTCKHSVYRFGLKIFSKTCFSWLEHYVTFHVAQARSLSNILCIDSV